MYRFLLACLLLLAPATGWAVAGDTCVLTANGVLAGGGDTDTAMTYTGNAFICTGSGGAADLTSGDKIKVISGVTTTIQSNVTFSNDTIAGLVVENGGTLRTDVVAATAPIVIKVGPGDLNCEAGSTCNLYGGLVKANGTVVSFENIVPDAVLSDTSYWWQVGDVIPCSNGAASATVSNWFEPDCTSNANRLMFAYKNAVYDPEAASPTEGGRDLAGAIAALNAQTNHTGDIIYFQRPADGGIPSGELWQWYAITRKATGQTTTTDNYIEIDVRQGVENPQSCTNGGFGGTCQCPGDDVDGWLLTDRDIKAVTVNQDVLPGTREIRINDGQVAERPNLTNCAGVSNNSYYESAPGIEGRWIRFAVHGERTCDLLADSAPCFMGDSYVIQKFVDWPDSSECTAANTPWDCCDSGSDTTCDAAYGYDSIYVASAEGVPVTVPAGARATIDYGIRTGDPFLVIRPVIIKPSTSATTTDRYVATISGDTALQGAVFDKASYLEVLGDVTIDIDYLILRDVGDPLGQRNLVLGDVTHGQHWKWIWVGAGDSPASGGVNSRNDHGLLLACNTEPCSTASINIYGLALRYNEDDAIVRAGTKEPLYNLNLYGYRNEWASCGGGSCQSIDFGTTVPGSANVTVVATDVYCAACGDDADPSFFRYDELRNAMILAPRQWPLYTPTAVGQEVPRGTNITILGGRTWRGTYSPNLAGINNLFVRDFQWLGAVGPGASVSDRSNTGGGVSLMSTNNALIMDSAFSGPGEGAVEPIWWNPVPSLYSIYGRTTTSNNIVILNPYYLGQNNSDNANRYCNATNVCRLIKSNPGTPSPPVNITYSNLSILRTPDYFKRLGAPTVADDAAWASAKRPILKTSYEAAGENWSASGPVVGSTINMTTTGGTVRFEDVLFGGFTGRSLTVNQSYNWIDGFWGISGAGQSSVDTKGYFCGYNMHNSTTDVCPAGTGCTNILFYGAAARTRVQDDADTTILAGFPPTLSDLARGRTQISNNTALTQCVNHSPPPGVRLNTLWHQALRVPPENLLTYGGGGGGGGSRIPRPY